MKRKILFVVALLYGLLFINAGLNKFFNYMPMPEELPEAAINAMKAMSQISWLMPLIGITEIIGGTLFIIPKLRALGALVILPILIGIVLFNTITDTSGLPVSIALVIIEAWIIIENKHKYMPLILKSKKADPESESAS
ncbi:DoxX family membrane protein [Fulvivirga sediminis]|uniref:DoxX family membrane protein n=1 Tax=Fulvivirga sediminis TaxID=2803949 RepID=A0A937JX97_9BACT|nr:DoxX family membrane protein [Fulvivirga sediminis]MBL3655283.1 DoxX family membrane protein [Fulvivirga sediminis]